MVALAFSCYYEIILKGNSNFDVGGDDKTVNIALASEADV